MASTITPRGILPSNVLSDLIWDPKSDFNITPILDWEKQIADGTIDVRLDTEFILMFRTQLSTLDPLRKEAIKSALPQYQKPKKIAYGQKFVLHPNELILGSTLEYLSFPADLMAYVIGRSSWGRLGLIIATATLINPGFRGNLTLELVNAGNVPIVLYPGVRIAQLVIHKLEPPEVPAHGEKYDVQVGPGFSKIYDDKELKFLRFPKYKSIIGLTGHKGCGKRIFSSYLIEHRLYKYFSLSHIVRDLYGQEKLDIPTRKEWQDFGDQLRYRRLQKDFLAREFLRRLHASEDITSETRILIDGIRNPAEVELLRTLPNFDLIAIDTPEKKIKKNLKDRGYLIDNNTYKNFEAETNAELISESIFQENYIRDCGSRDHEIDKEGYGQNVQKCIDLAGDKVVKFTDDVNVFEALSQFKALLRKVE